MWFCEWDFCEENEVCVCSIYYVSESFCCILVVVVFENGISDGVIC